MLRRVFDEIRAHERRKALRDAAAYAEQRADIAAELAPCGRLGEGLRRAVILHDLATDLRAMAEAGR